MRSGHCSKCRGATHPCATDTAGFEDAARYFPRSLDTPQAARSDARQLGADLVQELIAVDLVTKLIEQVRGGAAHGQRGQGIPLGKLLEPGADIARMGMPSFPRPTQSSSAFRTVFLFFDTLL